MNVHVYFWETPSSINLPLVIDLELRMPSINSDFFIAKLWLGKFTDFHISVSFVFAFNWLTEHIFSYFRMLSVETLSEIFDLFRNHNSLFWVFWSSLNWLVCGSEAAHLIFPSSCSPYMIFDMNMLSATFWIFLSFICTFGDHFFGVIISGTSTWVRGIVILAQRKFLLTSCLGQYLLEKAISVCY